MGSIVTSEMKCLDCGMNISMGTELIFVGTGPAGGPGSRLHDDIITCLIASKTDEIFKNSEC